MPTKVRLTADAITDKWSRRLKGAVSDVVAGVNAVSESPASRAIAKQDKMRQNLLNAIDDGRWAKGLSKVSLEDWKTKTAKKVQERLAGGVDGAVNKRKAFDSWLVSRLNSVLPEISAMPDLTLEDSINRVRRLIEFMASEKYKSK